MVATEEVREIGTQEGFHVPLLIKRWRRPSGGRPLAGESGPRLTASKEMGISVSKAQKLNSFNNLNTLGS